MENPNDINRCTKNDEFITKPCSCPVCKTENDNGVFGANEIVITDRDIIPSQIGYFQGHIFVCPKCLAPAIMVNKDMGNICCSCGAKVKVQSKIVTDYFRGLSEKRY